MTTRTLTASLLSTSLLLASAAVAGAEPVDGVSARVAPIQSAVEIGLTGGYNRTVGDIDDSMTALDDLTGPASNLELQIGYRIDPHVAVAAYGSAALYRKGKALRGSSNDLAAATAGVKADWHFRPDSASDPWLSLGMGVRWMTIEEGAPGQTHLFGLDLGRAQFGIDYRVSPEVSIAPVIGATATTFVSKDDAMTDGWSELDGKKVAVSFQAGFMGRFDLFARH